MLGLGGCACRLNHQPRNLTRHDPQGSACVYSKKVEFLYSLVFHALDLVTAQKRSLAARKSSIAPSGEDADIAFQEEEGFLELDDVLKEAANVDLVEEEGTQRRRRLDTPRDRLGATRLEQGMGDDPYRITSTAVAPNGALMLEGGATGLLSLSPIQHMQSFHARAPLATPALMHAMGSPVSYGSGGGASPIGSPGGPLPFQQEGAAPAAPAERRGRAGFAGTSGGTAPSTAGDPWMQLDPYAADESSTKPLTKSVSPSPPP